MVKRITTREVAKLAGVSPTTVSFVLNNVPGVRISDRTRQRVLEATQQLDYHPDSTARRMVTGRTATIAFVMRQTPDQAFADHFLPRVLDGISQAAARHKYHVLISLIPPGTPGSGFAELIHERHADGLLVSGPLREETELLQIHAEGAPVVLLGHMPGQDIPSVDIDNFTGAATATQHLLHLGHRRIGLITNADPAYSASADRLSGYRQSLEDAGVKYEPELVAYGNFTPRSGYQAMEELLALPEPPTAVFIASDTVALGGLQAARQSGRRVPDDLAIVGFDDIPLAGFVEPPLTTIHLPANGLGRGAAEMLIRIINGEKPIRDPHMLLETQLIVRKSSGAHQETIANTP